MITSALHAMGTDMELIVAAGPGPATHRALLAARRVITDLERSLSRFDPASELSRLNRDRRLDGASPAFLAVVGLALEARDATGGRFDPAVRDALVAAGYDRTFHDLAAHGRPARLCGPDPGTTATVDECTATVSLTGPGSLDFGGIAKGFAAEAAAEVLADAGPCLVNAGGDIAVRGVPASGGWPVAVPGAGGRSIVVELTEGGLATSGRDRRRWRAGGREQHHVIDPATGRPAVTDIHRITVFAPTAVDAETTATSLMILGVDAALAEARTHAIPAVVVTDDGRTLTSEALR